MSNERDRPEADTGDGSPARNGLGRRTYLGSVVVAATGLAGCSSRSEEDSTPPTEIATPAVTATATSETTELSTNAPTETPTADPAFSGVRLETETPRQTQPATVAVDVTNQGDASVAATVALAVSGESTDSASVSLAPGSTGTAEFEIRHPRVGEQTVEATLSVDGERQDTTTTSMTVEQYPPSFVGRDGANFVLDGSRFRYVGANNNHLPVRQWGRQYVDRLFEYLSNHGVSVVRTWGFPPAWTDSDVHPEPGTFRDDWFEHFDYVLLAAKRHDIRLVLPLLNNWYGGEHAPSPAAYADWSDTAETKNDFFGDEQANEYYRNYVEYVLTRTNQLTGVEYRDDPTILMWEVGNEIEYHDERRGEPLTNWYHDAASHIKSVDDSHLVGTGMHGATGDVFESWNVRNAYVETHESEAIDACSFHSYPVERHGGDITVREQEAFAEYVRTHVREAHEEVGKPAYFGEFGAVVDADGSLPVSQRNEFFRTATRVAREEGLDGVQFWFAELRDPKNDGSRRTHEDNPLAIFPDETSTWSVVEDYADSLE
ncbi:glycoside hydrolase 5 family protein [Halorussus litoreus]|uniref:glycoside hydrolase 5 family protein n=1 Tax=Halorussus litoreus TaxID=1710536 RepID=UPI000E2397B8|nr:cellulase family glycosylhydrolase [Halorussus litoreus]